MRCSTLSLLLGIWAVLIMLYNFTLHFFPFSSEMGEAKYWITVLLQYFYFWNTCSPSLSASAHWPYANSSADCAACLQIDSSLLSASQFVIGLPCYFLPLPRFHLDFVSVLKKNSMGKRWWDVNLGSMACNLWSNKNSWCCCCSVFLGRWT